MTIRPPYASTAESAPQGRVQALAHGDLMRISPAVIAEALHVHHENGPVDRGCGCGIDPLRNNDTSDPHKTERAFAAIRPDSGTTKCRKKRSDMKFLLPQPLARSAIPRTAMMVRRRKSAKAAADVGLARHRRGPAEPSPGECQLKSQYEWHHIFCRASNNHTGPSGCWTKE